MLVTGALFAADGTCPHSAPTRPAELGPGPTGAPEDPLESSLDRLRAPGGGDFVPSIPTPGDGTPGTSSPVRRSSLLLRLAAIADAERDPPLDAAKPDVCIPSAPPPTDPWLPDEAADAELNVPPFEYAGRLLLPCVLIDEMAGEA